MSIGRRSDFASWKTVSSTQRNLRDRAFQQQLSVLNQQARSEYREAWHSAVEKGAGSGLGPRCVRHKVERMLSDAGKKLTQDALIHCFCEDMEDEDLLLV